MNLISDGAFHAFLSVVTGGVAGLWAIHDALFYARLRGRPSSEGDVHDQRFGYVMGMVIGVVGVLGTLRFNGVF